MNDPYPQAPLPSALAALRRDEAAEADRRREDAVLAEAAVIRARRAAPCANRQTVHAGDRR